MDEEVLSAFCFLIVAGYMYLRFVRNPENEDLNFRKEDIAWPLPVPNAVPADYHGHVTRRRTHSSSGNDNHPCIHLDVQNYTPLYQRVVETNRPVKVEYLARAPLDDRLHSYFYSSNTTDNNSNKQQSTTTTSTSNSLTNNSIVLSPTGNSNVYGGLPHPAYSSCMENQGGTTSNDETYGQNVYLGTSHCQGQNYVPTPSFQGHPPFLMHQPAIYDYNTSTYSSKDRDSDQPVMSPPQYQQCTSESLSTCSFSTTNANHLRTSSTNPSMPTGPAQIQLEIAKKAQIPLFLHSPLFNRPSQDKLVVAKLCEETSIVPSLRETKIPDMDSWVIDSKEIELGAMIGQGAFGSVHKGLWRGTGVAVKILVCQNLSPEILQEFHSEVKIMSMLRHPNICMFMGACLEPPMRCLVIELVSNGSLWNVLRQNIVIDMELIMKFATQIAQGMNYLHTFRQPILHRDLKSPNLLVDSSYGIKISDFGLARAKAHFQTMTGNCGTIQWMAPEILAAQNYTEKADVYSFGIVCWEIVTRQCPYDGYSQIQAALGVLNHNLRPTLPVDCPEPIATIIQQCWALCPETRPSFAEILAVLHSTSF